MKKLWDFGWKMYRKYEEVVSYLFWGVAAFVLSMFLFWLFNNRWGWNEHAANILDWIIVVIFAYFTNRTFVFKSTVKDIKGMGKEFRDFVLARLSTLVLEEVILFVFITWMGYDSKLQTMIVKLLAQFAVIVANYVLSKLFIFKNKNK